MNTLSESALQYATLCHEGQLRKYTNEPYINHSIRVVEMVSKHTTNEHVIAAAYLHDVVEDCGVTIRKINGMFGYRVGAMVQDVTKVSSHLNGDRDFRLQLEIDHLKNALVESKIIKIADIIDNTKDICEHDIEFAKVYLPEKYAILHEALYEDVIYSLWNYAEYQIAYALKRHNIDYKSKVKT
jgi:(p)ppGpp synthase/HD superfamily hydrolase